MFVYEAITRFAEILADVERGHRVVITKHGKPIATLSPVLGTGPHLDCLAPPKLAQASDPRLDGAASFVLF